LPQRGSVSLAESPIRHLDFGFHAETAGKYEQRLNFRFPWPLN
jgi:hypothetical protein